MRILIFLFIFSTAVYAQDIDIDVVTYPEIPVVGELWTFTMFVDYPEPSDITVIPPSYNEALSLDRILISPRVTDDNIITVIEYRFIPAKSGNFILEKFTVISPEGAAQTAEFTFNIKANTEEQKALAIQLDWEVERSMRQGERVTLTLRGWDSRLPLPEFFLPSAPPGLILASMPFSERERNSGVTAKFTVIPLETGNIRFDARILQYENITFNIPALQINVSPQNKSLLNSDNSSIRMNDPVNSINFTEIEDYSGNSTDKRILQRRIYFAFSIFIFILVIITPLVCLTLFVRKK
jgi:hypothetical protein